MRYKQCGFLMGSLRLEDLLALLGGGQKIVQTTELSLILLAEHSVRKKSYMSHVMMTLIDTSLEGVDMRSSHVQP